MQLDVGGSLPSSVEIMISIMVTAQSEESQSDTSSSRPRSPHSCWLNLCHQSWLLRVLRQLKLPSKRLELSKTLGTEGLHCVVSGAAQILSTSPLGAFRPQCETYTSCISESCVQDVFLGVGFQGSSNDGT